MSVQGEGRARRAGRRAVPSVRSDARGRVEKRQAGMQLLWFTKGKANFDIDIFKIAKEIFSAALL